MPLEQFGAGFKLVQYEVHNGQVRSMRVISFSDARSKLKKVLDQVVSDSDYTIITRRDSEDAVVMSLDQFNALMETVHLLKSPANAAHLAESIKQYRAGQVKQHALTDD
jgi:antitoxin YefM